jgi:hypothetical protein
MPSSVEVKPVALPPGRDRLSTEPRGLDQRVHDGGALAAAIGAGEQPGLAAERSASSAASIAIGATARSISVAMVSSMRLPATLRQRRCPNCTFGCSHR